MTRTVLVTGAGGLIGSAACASLRERGADVVELTHRGESACDIADLNAVRAALRQTRPHTVLHTAYLLADATPQRPREAVAVNVLGFLNVLEACAEFGVHSLLYASSIAVYGAGAAGAPSPAPTSAYGTMKLLNEFQVGSLGGFARHSGIRIVNVYGDVLGRGQTGWVSTAVRAALSGEEATVAIEPTAEMSVVWAGDLGNRLAAVALSDPELAWPAVADGGGETVSGASLAESLWHAGAADVALGTDRYDYPARVESPWLDAITGGPVIAFDVALERMRALRGG